MLDKDTSVRTIKTLSLKDFERILKMDHKHTTNIEDKYIEYISKHYPEQYKRMKENEKSYETSSNNN